ncbi:MAG: Uma2 family endonuclease, partial [Planctomycetes bacterium]|nr:Uma2 family endonuclease [Planctomycetota bacterium]
MTAPQTHAPAAERDNDQVPPLVHGQRLTRAEFERRYDAMPELKKAELIEGVVYMPSPVRSEQHGGPHADVITWLGTYRAFTPGAAVNAEGTIRLGASSDPQPDAVLFIRPEHGGQARISSDDYVQGGPELAAEVAASSADYDLGVKLQLYQRHAIREYLVWRVLDGEFDWFVLRSGQYVRLAPDEAGVYHSEV